MWGIWSLKAEAWVTDVPHQPLEYKTKREATADLKSWAMAWNLKNYEVRKFENDTLPA